MKKLYRIKNRSASMVVYKIPEDGIRREFAPGEVKNIPYDELVKLTYQPGGRELMSGFLQLDDEEIIDNFNINPEPEYYMSEDQIKELILHGSLPAFLDALDYAPIGIIDLIKRFAVSLPIADRDKADALKEKTGFDVDAALKNMKLDKEAEKDTESAAAPTGRRVQPGTPGRRTDSNYKVVQKTNSTPNYKVVSK